MEDAPITTITHWAHENRVAKIDVLKTDTEGYDLRVLRGAAELLAAKTVTFVLSEVTFVPNEKFQTQFHELFTYLDSRDYGFVDIYDHCFERMAWPRVPPVSFANALFCVRDFAARMSMSGR